MAISRRLRFEVLRRDNHTCRYCGATAPDSPLTVDHVVPVALGGSDDPSNLITACQDCNNGKTSIAPGSELVDEVDRKAVRWAEVLTQISAEIDAERTSFNATIDQWTEAWDSWQWKGGSVYRPANSRVTIENYLRSGVPLQVLLEHIEMAMAKHVEQPWRYFCVLSSGFRDQLHERARKLIENGEV